MTLDLQRLAGRSLIAGTVVGAAGYLAANILIPGGDGRFTQHGWQLLNGIAIGGDILIVLGLPAILAVQGRRYFKLTLVGYVGLFLALVMLNIGEGVIEAFVKPYLATHGGIPDNPPAGFGIFETIALVGLLVGPICLGVALIRSRAVPAWVGILLIVSPVVGFLGLGGALAELSDYLAFIAMFTIGVYAVRPASAATPGPVPATA
jgi:hypothetical protein